MLSEVPVSIAPTRFLQRGQMAERQRESFCKQKKENEKSSKDQYKNGNFSGCLRKYSLRVDYRVDYFRRLRV